MSESRATKIVREYLLGKRKMDSEVYEAIRTQYLSCIKKEGRVA